VTLENGFELIDGARKHAGRDLFGADFEEEFDAPFRPGYLCLGGGFLGGSHRVTAKKVL